MGQAAVNVDVASLKERVCGCGCNIFTQMLALRELPALYSATGKPETLILQLGFVCVMCKAPMELVAGVNIDEKRKEDA